MPRTFVLDNRLAVEEILDGLIAIILMCLDDREELHFCEMFNVGRNGEHRFAQKVNYDRKVLQHGEIEVDILAVIFAADNTRKPMPA